MTDTQTTPTEFHKAVTQIVLHYIGAAQGVGHLATLAKAQLVASRAVRRVITRGDLTQRDPSQFTPQEIAELVMEEDQLDEQEGTGR